MIMFQGVIPTIGMGQLEPVQAESNFHKTEKERLLYSPRNVFWKNIADECADEGIGISMFLAPLNFLDVASIGKSVRDVIVSFLLSLLQVTLFLSPEGNFSITHVLAPSETRVRYSVTWIASYTGGQFTTVLCEYAVRQVRSGFSFHPVLSSSHLVIRAQGRGTVRELL